MIRMELTHSWAVWLEVLAVLCSLAHGKPPRSHLAFQTDYEWLSWKRQHDRAYEEDLLELERYIIWQSNQALVYAHNQYASTFGYTLELNKFADLSTNEYFYYTRCLLKYNYSPAPNNTQGHHHDGSMPKVKMRMFELPEGFNSSYLPTDVDWRTMGAVSSVKDQGRCLSCYAFSITAALEGHTALASAGKLVSLSEQNIIDCSVPYGNMGCSGGTQESSLIYAIDMGGIDTASSYPYLETQYICKFSTANIGARVTGMVRIKNGQEDALQAAVAIVGPVTIAIDHQHYSFQFYSYGIFDEPTCSSTSLTHSMVIVGYGTYNNKDYWLIKNSWGSNWGMGGYIMMARNKYNQCGIAAKAIYPSV